MLKPIILLTLILTAGCSDSLSTLTLSVENAHVDLAQQVEGDWDSVCILTPYTTDENAAKVTGLNITDVKGTGIENSDSFQVLVFLKNQALHRKYRVSMENARFELTAPWCFDKEQSYLVAD
ncbi:hypothetical protein QNI23_001070 [Bermanella sp. WJH001]|uniref:hypothetical protein n=1 Tax=Bermanella sp. WJH001 TaxID=3048005 RepID=UPI0024BD628A|nr:hypothetical protein [Bermanella sp. WJH001]MDJ1538653.1 hypothetical protein [Bermanella sp. WJH001]